MKKYRLPDLVPPWADGKVHRAGIIAALAFCAMLSSAFFHTQFSAARSALYTGEPGASALREGIQMEYFADLITSQGHVSNWFSEPVFFHFLFLFLGAILLAVYNYSGFRNGSKSHYLMRRLPDKWEYHRRCLALPLLAILAELVSIPILIGLFYALYLHVTPEQCLRPDQWEVFRESIEYLIIPVHLRFWEVF